MPTRPSFLRLLGSSATRFGAVLLGYCLMDNHYHLLVDDTPGNLRRFVRHLDAAYTPIFNRRWRRRGPVLRAWYRARIIDTEAYAMEALRYIHLNPVEAGLVRRAGAYPWSSHRYYMGGTVAPWLCTTTLLDQVTSAPGRSSAEVFDDFVHERLSAPALPEPPEPGLSSQLVTGARQRQLELF
jgi:REP element-mobilizing transposase RayT